MDFLSWQFFTSLAAIVFMDLLLAGDNAIVIGMAAKGLPKEQQKPAIIWGTLGAIVVRITATLAVVWILDIPYLRVFGGLVLMWIAYKLLVSEDKHDTEIQTGGSLLKAVYTIIIADAAMGLDNVLAIAGVADGDQLLVILGLLITIPIIAWGSTLFIKLMEKFPFIIYLGSAILAYTAIHMITEEPNLKGFFSDHYIVKWTLIIAVVAGVLAAGRLKNKQTAVKTA